MAVKILSVDDETDLELLLTQFFRRQIRKGEYEFYFAHNGLEALQLLLKYPDISIILLMQTTAFSAMCLGRSTSGNSYLRVK